MHMPCAMRAPMRYACHTMGLTRPVLLDDRPPIRADTTRNDAGWSLEGLRSGGAAVIDNSTARVGGRCNARCARQGNE